MGISSSTSKVTPIYGKEITGAADTLKGAYNAAAPNIQGVSDQITGLLPGLLDRAQNGDPSLNAAQGYITKTLGQDPAQNPFLDQMIAQTGQNTANGLRSNMGTRGITGGTAYQGILAQALAQNEGSMRYTDWNNGQTRQAQAAGMAPGVSGAQTALYGPAFDAANAVTMPLQAASGYAQGMGGLLGQYTNTKTSNPWGSSLLGGVGGVLSGLGSMGASFSDERLKENIRHVGQTNGGVPLYSYTYKGDDAPHIGPMAQEVAALQPDALGPEVGGFMTVRYGELV
jgi:hypothetical protein